MLYMEFVIVSGLSGAGKSTVAGFMEDMGFFRVDNLPAALIPKFAELCMASPGKYAKVAVVCDIRGGQTFDGLFAALDELKQMGCEYRILFVDAARDIIIQRYKETRHSHPLEADERSLSRAVDREIALMEPVRERADYLIRTTALSTAKLRGELLQIFGGGSEQSAMNVNVISFGFKYGVPIEADMVFDVRFLPNPFYIAELRNQTGLDEAVRSFVFGYQQTRDFMRHIQDLLSFLLPLFVEEGKTALVIAVGCTGGQHRSVAIARALAEFIRQKGYNAGEGHRDMTRRKT